MTWVWTSEVSVYNPVAVMDWPGGIGGSGYWPTSPPGVIGGAIIRAARRSASLTTRQLARTLCVGPATVRSWQNGTPPLFCLPHGQLRQLAVVLRDAGAQVGHDLRELLLASQCDLLVTGMLRGFEDYAEVPPIDEEGPEADAASALLRWALIGTVPRPYHPYASGAPLMSKPDAKQFVALALGLNAGHNGPGLIPFGAALVTLTQR